jgi:hypothetical protein
MTVGLAFGVVSFGHPTLDRVFRQLLVNRSFSFLGIWVAVSSGIVVAAIVRDVLVAGRRIDRRFTFSRGGPATVVAGLLLLAGLASVGRSAWLRLESLRPIVKVSSHFDTSPHKQRYEAAFLWLQRNGDGRRLVAIDTRLREFGEPGFNDLFSQVVLKAKQPGLGGLNVEGTKSSANGGVMSHLHDWNPEQLHEALRHYDVGWVIVYNQDAIANLSSSRLFESVFTNGPVQIFRVARRAKTGTDASVRPLSQDRFGWKVSVPSAGLPITLPNSWDPNWEARIDGRVVPIEVRSDNLIGVRAPASGRFAVQLRYRRNRLVDGLTLLSLLVQALGLWAFVRALRRLPVVEADVL